MKTNHTPAPWDYDGEFVYAGHKYSMDKSKGKYSHICEMKDYANWVDDARLISSAPDLLASCEKIIENWENSQFLESMDSDLFIELARVIKKAKGTA